MGDYQLTCSIGPTSTSTAVHDQVHREHYWEAILLADQYAGPGFPAIQH
jgi:hypothetical protein